MHELVERFDPVSLEELDERAALLRRVDNKYAVEREPFEELLEHLRDDHQVLEIDGRRAFGYCSTYFDTPELHALHPDHAGRARGNRAAHLRPRRAALAPGREGGRPA